MADFRKMFYALAIVALIACFTVPASAQSFACTSITATNQIARVEGWAEYIGDIVLGCTGGVPTGLGQQVKGADITVTLPQTQISSKIINSSPALSEATLIMDDIKDPTNLNSTNFAGNRNHLVCADTTSPGGLGVCNVISDGIPSHTYDGSGTGGDCETCTAHPNIFVAKPNGTNAVVFQGVPLDPPGTGFQRTIRITNIRINATVFDPSNPFAQVIAIISFQGPASVGLTAVQTQVAVVQRGLKSCGASGSGCVTSDSTFLQCEYPTSIDSETGDDKDDGLENETHGWTADFEDTCDPTDLDNCLTFNGKPGLAISITEGFETAFKPRNMSELLGTDGQVLGNCAADLIPGGSSGDPCIGDDGDTNSAGQTNIFAYSGGEGPTCIVGLISSLCPAFNPLDISQNSPGIRYFTEGGFSETGTPDGSAGFGYTPGAGFVYSTCKGAGPNNCVGAGFADYGTRLQFTIANIPSGSVVSLPTVVSLMNGTLVSGVMVMTSVSGTGKGQFNPVGASSGIPAIQGSGYVDLNGPSQTVTYEVIFSDPFSVETANIYPVVYYPAGSLPTDGTSPQANVTATVTAATFAPWYASTGNQSNNGQVDGTPRFTHTTSTAPFALFTINHCTCSLLFPWVVSDANYVTGIAVANTSADPSNTALGVLGYTAGQQQGTVQLYLFGTTSAGTAQAMSNISNPAAVPAAVYPGSDTLAKSGSYATFIVNSGFTGYAITQANFQYCHGLAFLFNATGAVPPVSYLGLTMDQGSALGRTVQLVNDGLVH